LATVSPPPTEPSRKDRIVAKVASFVARSVWRDVDVHWSTPAQTTGPELTVANHFGGVADALLILHAMPRPPGIVARDVIWKVPVVGWLMNLVGAIPVHKPDDRGPATSNDQMFASCYAALRDGQHVLIFPEGVTRNEPSIAQVKTGAARIALGARASGAHGLMITPVGIHYEDKAALRSRVVINVGEPIELDHRVPEPVAADDRAAVGALTAEIERALREAAPDYDSWEEERALTLGAEIALRSTFDDPRRPVPIGLRERLANVLADRSPERRLALSSAVSTYQQHLDGLGVTDADVHARSGLLRFGASLAVQFLIAVVLLPFALAGAIVNIIPFLVVRAVGRLRVAPSMHATIKPLVAVVAFGVTWAVMIWLAGRAWGLEGAAAALVLLPVYLAGTTLFIEHLTLLGRIAGEQFRSRRAGSATERLDAERAAVIEAVWRR
jgi:glycerol-3-phosphate O-acyltransferase/dihydroxyacetone phosphate acyltransferase